MYFNSMDEFKKWLLLNKKYNFDGGSQGECYKIGNEVYKIFSQYIDEDYYYISDYTKDDIMRFSSIYNNTYIWPKDVIMVNDTLVGYTMDYVNAKSLFKINPFLVNLDKFEKSLVDVIKDIEIISNNGVSTYDVCYNVLYGHDGFKIIDTLEYSLSNGDPLMLLKHNSEMFVYEIKMFLVDGYFDNVINDNKKLYNMYVLNCINIVDFLKEFRNRLSEIEDKEIVRLCDAKKSLVRSRGRSKYVRDFNH